MRLKVCWGLKLEKSLKKNFLRLLDPDSTLPLPSTREGTRAAMHAEWPMRHAEWPLCCACGMAHAAMHMHACQGYLSPFITVINDL